jgi:hypothetical protein
LLPAPAAFLPVWTVAPFFGAKDTDPVGRFTVATVRGRLRRGRLRLEECGAERACGNLLFGAAAEPMAGVAIAPFALRVPPPRR